MSYFWTSIIFHWPAVFIFGVYCMILTYHSCINIWEPYSALLLYKYLRDTLIGIDFIVFVAVL